MNQCIQIAEHHSIPSNSLKRKQSSDNIDAMPKRRAVSDSFEQHAPLLSASPHVSILPRPANGYAEGPPSQPAALTPPKKRGRPSRADKAKRDLRPLLPQHPQHLAPRLPPIALAPNAPRQILPSVNANQRPRPETPPAVYSASPASDGPPGKRKGRAPLGVNARPASTSLGGAGSTPANVSTQRVLAEDFINNSPHRPSGPVPLEPDPDANTHLQGLSEGMSATLPALVDKGVARLGSNYEARAPLANSA